MTEVKFSAAALKAGTSTDGSYKRSVAPFREWIYSNTEEYQDKQFVAEKDRYLIYVSYACPWANRVLAVLNMKGLQDAVSVVVVHPTWQRTRPDSETDDHAGWHFRQPDEAPPTNRHGIGSFVVDGHDLDPTMNARFMRDIYEASSIPPPEGGYSRSVPAVWCKKHKCIVSNESAEIIEMLNGSFQDLATKKHVDLFPKELRDQMDELNLEIYNNVNNGVYKCGFGRTQEAYNTAMNNMYGTLDKVESILEKNRYLMGPKLTAADIRLFMTLIRFDEVYVVYFKCNRKLIREYPNMWGYVKELYQIPDIRKTVRMDHIKTHYFSSHVHMNYFGIIPQGPGLEVLDTPHKRDHLLAEKWD